MTSSGLRLLLEKYIFFDLVGIIFFFCSVLIFHFCTSAIIRFIFNQRENCSSKLPKRSSSTAILFIFTCFFDSGSSGCVDTGTELSFHDDCGFNKIICLARLLVPSYCFHLDYRLYQYTYTLHRYSDHFYRIKSNFRQFQPQQCLIFLLSGSTY